MSASMPLAAGDFSAASPTPTSQDPCGKTLSQRNDGPGFPCHLCGSVISRKPDLRRHMETHDKAAEKLKCEFCPYECLRSQKSNLKAHMRKHTGEQPFVCGFRDCDFRCGDPSSLCRHRKQLNHPSPASIRKARAKKSEAVHGMATSGSKKLKRMDKAKAQAMKKGKAVNKTPSASTSRQVSSPLPSTRSPSPVLSIEDESSPSSSSSGSSSPMTPSSPFPSAQLPAQDYPPKRRLPLPSMEFMEALYKACGYEIPSVEDIRSILTPLHAQPQPAPPVAISVESSTEIGSSPDSAIWIEDDDDLDASNVSGPVMAAPVPPATNNWAIESTNTVPSESMLLQIESMTPFDIPLPSPPSDYSPAQDDNMSWQNAPTFYAPNQDQQVLDWAQIFDNGPQLQPAPSPLQSSNYNDDNNNNNNNNMFVPPPLTEYIPSVSPQQQPLFLPSFGSQNDLYEQYPAHGEMLMGSFLMDLDQRYPVQAFTS